MLLNRTQRRSTSLVRTFSFQASSRGGGRLPLAPIVSGPPSATETWAREQHPRGGTQRAEHRGLRDNRERQTTPHMMPHPARNLIRYSCPPPPSQPKIYMSFLPTQTRGSETSSSPQRLGSKTWVTLSRGSTKAHTDYSSPLTRRTPPAPSPSPPVCPHLAPREHTRNSATHTEYEHW